MCSWKLVLGLIPCSVRCSKSTADPRIQTWLVPRSSSLSFVLLHAGNCSPHLFLWPGSSALEKLYFFNGGKSQSYIELKIPIMDACLAESPTWSVVFPVMVPVSFAVCSKAVHIHLITHMESKHQRQKACGGVSAMMLEPVFIDVFHKRWIINQDLFFFDFDFPWNWNICEIDGACGESGDNPAQVQGFEGDQDHAHICCQLFVALRINKVVSGLAPNIWFVASSGGTVHSEHKVMGVNILAVLRLPEVPRVAHDGAAPAGVGSPLLQRVPVPGDDPKQLCESGVQTLRSFLSLQFQPPPVAVFWDQGILWGQERLHSWVKSLIEPEGTSQLWNTRATAARSPGVLEEFLDVLWQLHGEMSGVPGGRGHLVGVVQHKRRHRDEQKGEGEHFHVPPPYHNHFSPSGSATTAGQEQRRVQSKAKKKGCSRCLPVTTPGLGCTDWLHYLQP